MKTFEAIVIDKAGIHARPASVIVSTAAKFEAKIKLISGAKEANLKSIMNIMALGLKAGDKFTITAEGYDEDKALDIIKKTMIENKII